MTMAESSIEWTDATWNPVAGCTVLTAGCTNCYAMRMAARLYPLFDRRFEQRRILALQLDRPFARPCKGVNVPTSEVGLP